MEPNKPQRDKMILADLSSSYTCRICNEILINTMETNCGHRFCRYCAALSLHNSPNCLECAQPLLSAKLDESTDRKIDSMYRRGSTTLQQQRKQTKEIRSASEKEMKERFNVDATEERCQTQISDNMNTNGRLKSRGSEYYMNFSKNAKILENKLFKTYDKLLSQISPSKSVHQLPTQTPGPKGDHCSDEDQAKIEQVAQMAAKTAAEAFQNLTEADDLLKEADDVLGIIDFLKTHSMDSFAKDAESFQTDSKANFEEQMDLEVNKGYDNIQQILKSISSKRLQSKSKVDTMESSKSSRNVKIENEYFNMDSTEFATQMKKCKEALHRIRNENIKSMGTKSRDNPTTTSTSSSKNPSKCDIIRTVKWREVKSGINNRMNGKEAFKKGHAIKKAPPKSPNDCSQFKLPPLFEDQEL